MANLNIAIKIAAQDAASGPIGQIKNALGGLSNTAQSGFSGLQTVAKVAGGALVAGAGLVAGAIGAIGTVAFGVSNDVATATADIQSFLGTTTEDAERLGDVAANVWGNNFAGSITEAAGAVGLIRQQLGDLADNELQRATENAFRLADTFEIDTVESINTAKVLMEDFGLSSDEAFDFITKGVQDGLNANGDFLESISEYSNVFADSGFAAEDFYSIMETGQAGGVLGTDKISDAIKEMGVILNEGGDNAREAFLEMGINYDALAESVASGETTWADHFDTIVDGINGIEDPLMRQRAQVGIFGTMAEDLGVSFTEGLSTATTSLEDMAGATDTLDSKYNTLSSTMEGYKRRGMLALQPIGDLLLGMANNALPLVEQGFAFFETSVVPAVELAAVSVGNLFTNIGELFANIEAGMSPVNAISGALATMFGPEVSAGFVSLVAWIQNFITLAGEALAPVMELIAEFVSWQDVLVALGIVIGSVVLSALGSIVAAALPVIAVAAALIAGVALVRNAWENDWGGIASFLTDAWETRIQPALLALQQWVIEQLIPTVQDLYSRWVNEWWPQISAALGQAWDVIAEIFGNLKRWVVEELIPTVIDLYTTWSGRWTEIQTALQNVWTIVEEIFTELGRWMNDNLGPWVEVLRDKWSEDWAEIQSALETVWSIIEPIWIAVGDWLDKKIPEALGKLEGKWLPVMEGLEGPVSTVTDAVDGLLTAAKNFWEWLSGKVFSFNISLPDLPDWALPGSPLPIHTAWSDFERDMSQMRIAPQADFSGMGPMVRSGGDSVTAITSGPQVTIYGGLTLQGVQDGSSLLEQLNDLA